MHHRRPLWLRIIIRTINVVVLLFTIYFIAFQLFPYFDRSHSLIVALLITYLIASFIIFPLGVRISGALTRRKPVARYTSSGDGLAMDPVNIVVVGSLSQLKKVFKKANWHIADDLNIKTSFRMLNGFIRNREYLTAPFGNLYLFGRRQDIGFQKPIGKSPRHRHHVRFWALQDHKTWIDELSVAFWHSKSSAELKDAQIWVGAGTRDTGLGINKMTLQLTHSVDKDTNKERDFMVKELEQTNLVKKVDILSRDHPIKLSGKKINLFIADGRVAVVFLN